ncbi:ABC transporter ATP-binding protein [Seonamhaeicola sp.]|uniref:ABC transporter ATP-binding protein n=1 Tax=Seonamhaeicola sp. TaxID=1912245 RepID=UPI002622AF2A|nr:ABC transporter ATP-binding protein [Seonamhaeicola sp.]
MSNSIVSIQNLSHRYTTDWAVKDVSFDISDHGVLGLLGANGAGKSTIMNVMCGVLNQTEGDVLIDGINIRKDPVEAKKHMGFLPQKAPLYLDSTVDEYLEHCAYLRQMGPDEIPAAMERVKEKCGLGHFSKRLIKNLSGGYRQRTGIAGAIIHNPKLVVLDEPTVGLDPVQIVEVRKIIEEIGKDRAVIFSTHIMSEVQAVCNDIKMIDHGKLVFSGSVETFNDYIKPDTIIVVAEALPELAAFTKIDGITNAEQLNEKKVRVTFNASQEVAERIVEASVTGKWKLREIIIERSTLDDVFAKMTKDLEEKNTNQ